MSSYIHWHLVPFRCGATFGPTYTLSTLYIVAGSGRLLLHEGGPMQRACMHFAATSGHHRLIACGLISAGCFIRLAVCLASWKQQVMTGTNALLV